MATTTSLSFKTIHNTFESSPMCFWLHALPSVLACLFPLWKVIEVSQWLIENTPDLRIRTGSSSVSCQHGLAMGARFVLGPLEGQVFDYLPASALDQVRNLDAFARMLALDKWTCNTNGRQEVF